MLKLVLQGETEAEMEVSISTKPIILGRGEGSTFLLNDPSVSQNHAKIMMRQGKVYIRDLESANGVLVNGEQISTKKSRIIISGDRIEIGIYNFTLQELAESNDMTMLSPAESTLEEDELHTKADVHFEDQHIKDIDETVVINEDEEADEEATVLMGMDQLSKLVIIKGIEKGKEYLLDKNEMLIGRSEDNDIRINDSKVSRGHHAKLTIDEDNTVKVEDLNSTNGIYAKGKRVSKVNLSKSNNIQIGETILRYVEWGESFSIDDIGPEQNNVLSGSKNILKPVFIAFAVLILILIVFLSLPDKKDKIETVEMNESVSVTSHLFNASAFLETGSWSKAVEELNKVISVDADNANAIELRSLAETELKNKEQLELAILSINEKKYDTALGILEKIPLNSFYFKKSVDEVGKVNELIVKAKKNKKRRVPLKRKIYSMNEAIDMYAIGQSEKALSMLNNMSNDSKNKDTAKKYGDYIKKAEQSFRAGTNMYNSNNIDGAVEEWKKTLVYEKELPLKRKSLYASQIAGAAADEFYKKGFAYHNNGDLSTAIDNWIKALESSPDHKDAMSALESVAAQLYEQGIADEGSNLEAALQRWNDILYVVPKGSAYHNKALEKINQYTR